MRNRPLPQQGSCRPLVGEQAGAGGGWRVAVDGLGWARLAGWLGLAGLVLV